MVATRCMRPSHQTRNEKLKCMAACLLSVYHNMYLYSAITTVCPTAQLRRKSALQSSLLGQRNPPEHSIIKGIWLEDQLCTTNTLNSSTRLHKYSPRSSACNTQVLLLYPLVTKPCKLGTFICFGPAMKHPILHCTLSITTLVARANAGNHYYGYCNRLP